MTNQMTNHNVGDRWREARKEFWKHPALEYANSMISFNAIRTGTKGWEGESGNVALDKFAETILAAQMEEVERELKYKDFNPEDTEMSDPFHVDGYNMAVTDLKALFQSKRG